MRTGLDDGPGCGRGGVRTGWGEGDGAGVESVSGTALEADLGGGPRAWGSRPTPTAQPGAGGSGGAHVGYKVRAWCGLSSRTELRGGWGKAWELALGDPDLAPPRSRPHPRLTS
jgi:hypothetical protein